VYALALYQPSIDSSSPAFFITGTGRPRQRGVQETFSRLLAPAGVPAPPGVRAADL
jgi:hypothetical protein